MNPAAFRALARVELRQLRRNPARSLLVLLLVAIPVAAVAGGGALHRTTRPTLEERRTQRMGAADLRVEVGAGAVDELLAALPAGARAELVGVGVERVRVPGRRFDARAFALDPSGLAAGMLVLSEGRAPRGDGEVALSRVLERSLGDSITLRDGVERVVCGVVADPENLDLPVVLRFAGAPGELARRALLVGTSSGDSDALAERLRAGGWSATARGEVAGGDGFESLVILVVGGFAFFEAALVIAAAFAVGLRRRQRELGLLGAAGAVPGQVSTALVASAVALAALGCLVGLGLGLGSAAALHPFLDGWNRRLNGPLELSGLHAGAAVALGLVTAGASAAWPARAAARLPLRVALAGRRPVAAPAGRWLAVGVVLVVVGVALLLLGSTRADALSGLGLVAGSACAVLGLCATTPWILDRAARAAGRLPIACRLAVRDSGRFRARNGPVVTAVLAGMSVSVLVAALVASVERALAAFQPLLRDDWLLVEGAAGADVADALAAELPVVARGALAAVQRGDALVLARAGERGPRGWIACGDEGLLHALGADAGVEAFRAGRLLVLVAPGEQASAAELELRAEGGHELEALEAALVACDQVAREPRFLLSAETLVARGLAAGPPPRRDLVPRVLRLAEPVGAEALDLARRHAAARAGTSVDAARLHRRPTRVFYRALLAVCVATGLVVILIATALSAAEGAADAAVLHTVGASPSLLRRHLAARAGYLALLGCVLAVPAGLLPAIGLQRTANVALEFSMPWRDLLLVVLGLPALAYGLTWLFSVRRAAVTPRRRALS